MSSAIFTGMMLGHTSVQSAPNTRGPFKMAAGVPIQQQRFSTDAIGASTVTVSGVLLGSEIRLFLADGSENSGGIESTLNTSNVVFTYNVYTIPTQAYLVILLPGYHPMRVPLQLSSNPINYTAYQTADPAYI